MNEIRRGRATAKSLAREIGVPFAALARALRPKPEAILPGSASGPSGAAVDARRCQVRIKKVLL
jgi:hypothetical protein